MIKLNKVQFINFETKMQMHKRKLRAKILIIAAMAFASVNLFLVAKPARALGTPWFGGFILDFVPPTALCPPYTMVFDFSTDTEINIFVDPTSIVFPNFDLLATGTFVKGLDVPVPSYPSCPLPMYPIIMVGTS